MVLVKVLVTIHFPIADARQFVPELDLQLPYPDWPDPDTDVPIQFVHHFGNVRERFYEPDEAWPDELIFCQAKRALRFDRLETHHAGPTGRRFHPRCVFRRFFFDGEAVARVEIGIGHNRRFGQLTGLSMADALAIVRVLAALPTMVRKDENSRHHRPIIRQGKALANLYASASLAAANAPLTQKATQLVEVGDPLIVVELDRSEAELSPSYEGITTVPHEMVNGVRAYFCRLQILDGIVSTWILHPGTADKAQFRSLRICLTRLHAEQETLDRVLKQIHRRRLLNPGSSEAVDSLDSFFNDRLKIVNRSEWAGINQSQILAAFDATQQITRPASKAGLVNRYEGARRQVWTKVQRFQEERKATRLVYALNIEKGAIKVEKKVTVSGTGNIVNVAEYMSNLTNTVNNNLGEVADDQIRALIEELRDEIEKLANETDPELTKKLGKNLKQLSEEAASDEPDRRWYELSLEGLKEAAQAVGEIASPVLAVVTKLTALLIP